MNIIVDSMENYLTDKKIPEDQNGHITPAYNKLLSTLTKLNKFQDSQSWRLRSEFTQLLSWSIPSNYSINLIKQFVNIDAYDLTILEIGSGNGLWARLLKEAGLCVISTDDNIDSIINLQERYFYTNVEKLNAINAIKKYNDINVLMLCWPCSSDEMTTDIFNHFIGDFIIYIGIPSYNSIETPTATSNFIKKLESEFDIEYHPNFTWKEVNDCIHFCTRKNKK